MSGLKGVLFGLVRDIAADKLLARLKRRAGLVFANIIDGTRRGLLLVVVVSLTLQLLVLSFGGTLVTAILLWGGENKLYWMFGICATLLVAATSLVTFLMSRRAWFRVAGVAPDALGEPG